MSELKDFDWFIDRLEVAQWKSEETGSRDALTNCPVHGGSDSLHVTEKNGKALVRCFAQQCPYDEVVAALESGETPDESEEPAPRRRRRRTIGSPRGREDDPSEPVEADSGQDTGRRTRGVRLSPASTIDPEKWLRERCGIADPAWDELYAERVLPHLSFTATEVVFEFPEAQKIRGVGEGKKGKQYRWSGTNSPPLWPMPDQPREEIVITEGEMDAIILRLSGHDAYSITKGANAEVPQVIWDALYARGVERVRLAYDLDDAGRKGRSKAQEAVGKTGMMALPSRPVGIDVLAGEKDVRDVALRLGLPVDIEDDSDEDDSMPLEDVDIAPHSPPLLDRLHPQEHTILFGHGGTGKGVIAAWWVARLTRLGKRVLIVDYEQHAQHEWRPRVERFGGKMDAVRITQPTKPIWDVIGHLRHQVSLHDIDYVVIDSVTYACVGSEVEDSVTAVKYSMAIAMLQRPVLSLAHVTKENKNPDDPFGSAFWSNGARVTISVSRGEEADSPRVLRNAKTNQRGPFKTVAIRWDWLSNVEVGHDPHGCTNRSNDGFPHLDEMAAYTNKRQAIIGFFKETGRWPVEPEEVDWADLDPDKFPGDVRQARHQHESREGKPVNVRRRKRPDAESD